MLPQRKTSGIRLSQPQPETVRVAYAQLIADL
jgi:hypothetical protein